MTQLSSAMVKKHDTFAGCCECNGWKHGVHPFLANAEVARINPEQHVVAQEIPRGKEVAAFCMQK